MSISSNDSIFDDEDNFILDDQEEIDYYAVLNVPRNVSFLLHHFLTVSN